MLGVGIIGGGRVAPGHARAVKNNADKVTLKAVAESNEERRMKRQQEWVCDGYADYRVMLEREDVNIVILCLPHHLHAPVALTAIEAGKHVFIEKPMALTLEDCDAMIEAARKRGVKLGVGHHHCFTPVNVKAKALIDSGKIGRVIMATDTWHKQFFDPAAGQRPPWFLERESGGGIVWMNGPHLINRMMFFTGSDVVAVKAYVGSPFFGFSAQDAAMALLHFANGVYATIISTGHKTGVTRFEGEITGTEGMLKVGSRLWVSNAEEQYDEVPVEPYNTFDRQLRAFVESIEQNIPPPVSGEYGRKIVQVMRACEESSRTGREVVLA